MAQVLCTSLQLSNSIRSRKLLRYQPIRVHADLYNFAFVAGISSPNQGINTCGVLPRCRTYFMYKYRWSANTCNPFPSSKNSWLLQCCQSLPDKIKCKQRGTGGEKRKKKKKKSPTPFRLVFTQYKIFMSCCTSFAWDNQGSQTERPTNCFCLNKSTVLKKKNRQTIAAGLSPLTHILQTCFMPLMKSARVK